MAIASVPKAAASKFINIAAPSIQALLRPSTQFLQSPVVVDPRFFNLPQPETERSTDSPTVHFNPREFGFAKNWSPPPLGYSAARKPAPTEDEFSEEDEEVEERNAFGFEDEDFSEKDDEDFDEDEDEEESEKPKRFGK